MSSSNCPHFYYWILTGITDGTPPVIWCYCLLPRQNRGWMALLGDHYHYCHLVTGTCLLIDIYFGMDLVLLSFTPGETGAIGWPALRAGGIILLLSPPASTGWNKDLHNVMEESILNFA